MVKDREKALHTSHPKRNINILLDSVHPYKGVTIREGGNIKLYPSLSNPNKMDIFNYRNVPVYGRSPSFGECGWCGGDPCRGVGSDSDPTGMGPLAINDGGPPG